jgi:hypothetical protein
VFTFPFPYMARVDIFVLVNGVSVPYTYVNASTIQCAVAPFAGSSVQIRRITQRAVAPVDFADGSVLLESDLDTLTIYTLYVAQESAELDARIAAMENTILGLTGGVPGAIYRQAFMGDGATTIFLLNISLASAASADVFVGGIYQSRDSFSISGKNLYFSEAPPPATVIEIRMTA